MQIHLDGPSSEHEKLMESPFNLAKQENNMLPVNRENAVHSVSVHVRKDFSSFFRNASKPKVLVLQF